MVNQNFIGSIRRRRVEKANRPTVRPEMAPIDWLLELVALMGVVFLLGFAIYEYPRLPDTIPSHFNGAGVADEYSSKDTFWILPGIGVFIYLLLSLIVLVPHQFNFAVTITPKNALKQYTMAVRFVRYLKVVLIWLFLYISYLTVRVVANEESGLGLWFLPITLGCIFIPLVIYVSMSFKHK
ncbi:MAG: DUF1648 domain-containing protein [Bacteroidetes bacterium]|nr:DUF1648 domain-containing protein [Bacteroidota bacterium]